MAAKDLRSLNGDRAIGAMVHRPVDQPLRPLIGAKRMAAKDPLPIGRSAFRLRRSFAAMLHPATDLPLRLRMTGG
jgi:hypothetical protein